MGRRLTLVAALGAAACDAGPAGPDTRGVLEFGVTVVELHGDRAGAVEIRNAGGRAVGPVSLLPGAVVDGAGAAVPCSRLLVDPGEIPALNPGDVRRIGLELALDDGLPPGSYAAALAARAGATAAALTVRFHVDDRLPASASVRILADPATLRAGDVLAIPVEVRGADGAVLPDAAVSWSVMPAAAGFASGDGRFVGYATGAARVVARAGSHADTLEVVVEPRGLVGSFTRVGSAVEERRFTSDLWLHGDVAYSGTWGARESRFGYFTGDRLNVWDVSSPAQPKWTADVVVDARTVNDVKVRADGRLAVITHEGSADAVNGVTFLDLTDPLHPRVVSRFTAELEPGVHNAWLDGSYAYLAVDGTGSGLKILDVSDPASPRLVARYWAGTSFIHDVYVRDGLAFLSHWGAGLVILDVGHGIAGGSPEAPVEVSRLATLGGETHNAWYWPEAGYVFVGEEDFQTPGIMHVVDVGDLRAPREVATFAVPGQPPHNFWLDEEAAVLYLAWYGNGVRALDVSGALLGALERQGREIASVRYNDATGTCSGGALPTCTWAPQLHRGLLWVSDMNAGLVALRPPG